MFPWGVLSFTALLKVHAQTTLSGYQTTAGGQLQQNARAELTSWPFLEECRTPTCTGFSRWQRKPHVSQVRSEWPQKGLLSSFPLG